MNTVLRNGRGDDGEISGNAELQKETDWTKKMRTRFES